MWTMSDASTGETNVPRRGCTATRFSSASRLTASRNGVRPTSSSRISASSRSTVPGREAQRHDPVAQLMVGAVGEEVGGFCRHAALMVIAGTACHTPRC